MNKILFTFIYLLFLSFSVHAQKVNNISVQGSLTLPNETSDSAAYIDGSGNVKGSSAVDSTELERLDGLDDNIVTKLDEKVGDSGDETISGVKTFTDQIVASSTTKGFRPCPVMTDAEITAIVSPSEGDCAYNSTLNNLMTYDGTSWNEAGGAGGISNWETSHAYLVDDVVIQSGKIYQCLTGHTSGTFATDLAAAKWVEISNTLTGSSQAGSSVDIKTIQVPNYLLTQTGTNTYLIESGNNNILANPSFEAPISGGTVPSWTLTAGTAAAESTVVKHGAQSVKITLSAQTLEFYQASTRYQAQFADGINSDRKIWVKTTVSGIYVCPRNAGSVVYSACATVDSSGKWLEYNAPYVLGGTSNGIAVVSGTMSSGVVTPGNVTGDVYVDGEAYVGETKSLFGTPIITPWQSYTPTFTGFGTATNIDFKWRQVGSSVEIQGRFSAGTPTATEARVSLPGNYTTSSSNTLGQMVGKGSRNVTANGNNDYNILISPSQGYFKFALNNLSGTDALDFGTGTGLVASGNVIELFASIPVNELAGSTQVFASQCGANCRDSFSVDGSSAGATTSEDAEWITFSSLSTSTYTYNFSTTFTVAPQCDVTVYNGILAAAPTVSTTSIIFTTNNTSGSVATRAHSIKCSRVGADLNLARTLIGSFKEVVTAPGITKPKTCYYAFGGASATLTSPTECTTGTCIEIYDSCGTASPPAWNTIANYTDLTWAAGTWASNTYVKCECKSYDVTTTVTRECVPYFSTGDSSISSTASGGYVFNTASYDVSGTQQTTYTTVECQGEAP